MASRKGSRASRKGLKRASGKKVPGNQGLIVFAFVMAVVAFVIWHNTHTQPTRPSRPAQAVRPSVRPKPSEEATPRRRPAPAKPSKPAEAVKPAKPSEPARPPRAPRPSGLLGFFFRPADLDSKTAGAFKRFGLTEDTLVKRLSVEKRFGDTRYFRTYAEYEVPAPFAWRDFEPALRRALKGSPFRVNTAGHRVKPGCDVYSLSINRGELIVMRLEIRARSATVPLPAVPPIRRPRVAIVVDDFGCNMNNIETFLGIGEPLTISVLPRQPYSARVARLAGSRGFEVILHLPLESWRSNVPEEADTIRPGMSEGEICSMLAKELADVPGAIGVNNHQGSKGTEDRLLMTTILRYLKGRGLFFLDSLTSPRSVCREVASSVGVRYARRSKFLDNDNDPVVIEQRLAELKAAAMANGKAIAICHDRKNTAAVLARVMPEMAKDGIDFVPLSEMVK